MEGLLWTCGIVLPVWTAYHLLERCLARNNAATVDNPDGDWELEVFEIVHIIVEGIFKTTLGVFFLHVLSNGDYGEHTYGL